ncbi:hypothetical protein TWF128_008039 [Orbilia oligospora]|nr:hypothetical protein TWF128_008039 [Orbilia oligospora]
MPDRREIVIVLRHDMTDGMGSLILLNHLIKILRQEKDFPRFGDEPTRLTPSLAEIMHAENPSIDATKEAHLVKENFTKLRAMSLKTNPNQSNTPGNSNYVHEFSEEKTSTILKACKERGITIINVSNAAMAKTLLELSGEESGRFCSLGAINLRDMRVEGLHSYWKYKKNTVECIGALPELVEEGFTTAAKNGITVPSIVAVRKISGRNLILDGVRTGIKAADTSGKSIRFTGYNDVISQTRTNAVATQVSVA